MAVSTTAAEIEKLAKVGVQLGYEGKGLQQFVDNERARIKQENDAEREARLKQRELEKVEREKDHAMKEKEIAMEIQKQELEMKKIAMLTKLEEMKKESKENDNENGGSGSSTPVHQVKTKAPKLHSFQEGKDDMDAYLLRYERYATAQGWKRESDWAINLSTLLTGNGLKVYSALSDDEANDYDTLKEAILKRYELTEEGFRTKFRSARPEIRETPAQFVTRISNYLTRWVELSGTDKTYAGITDLLIKEQFIKSVHKELSVFLKERQPEDSKEMAKIAEQYIEAHGGWHFSTKPKAFKGNRGQSQESKSESAPKETSRRNVRTCFICDKPGHMAKDCRLRGTKLAAACKLVSENENNDSEKTTENKVDVTSNGKCTNCKGSGKAQVACCMIPKTDKDPHVRIVEGQPYVTLKCGHKLPVLSAACNLKVSNLPIKEGLVGSTKVKVLRDSGCGGVVVKSSLVSKELYTGETERCYMIDMTVREFPLARIRIKTPWYSGMVQAMVTDTPVCDLVLGSIKGARDPGVPDPDFQLKLCSEERDMLKEPLQEEVSEESKIDVSCAVETRSQTLMKGRPFKGLKVVEPTGEEVTVEKLKVAQQDDPSLKRCRELAKEKTEKIGRKDSKQMFIMEKGILYRQFQAPKVDFGNVFKQVVVPLKFRTQVMRLAHESILGGHQGPTKTSDKVLSNFYWPGVQADVKRYCQSCDICQRTIPKGRVTKVPLGDMPVIDVPFDRVAIDLVGPLNPCSDRGNRYILVLVDYATRYPEATPMKSIEAERVAEELVVMFTRLGIPREVLTDLGTQFTSRVMKEVSRLLSIKQLTTTPYHPSCNGLVERFNGSLKSLLRKICEEKPKDWDRYIAPLLFAYRETPHDSTGFAPFELLYGRTVRGPMSILRELWTGEVETPETKTIYQYVIDLKNRLEETCKMARAELLKSKARYRKNYNRKAKSRKFAVGDEVLLLLPTDHNKLIMHWKGPFTVVEKVSQLDYKIDLGKCQKTFHANLLKLYHRRDGKVAACIPVELGIFQVACASVIEEEPQEVDEVRRDPLVLKPMLNEDLLHLPPLDPKESLSDVHVSENLDETQRSNVEKLLDSYQEVLTDLPGKTNLGEHEIKLVDDEPVKRKPYPIPHALRGKVREEIQTMLKMGIIERSNSPYASPLVICKKSDGSDRYCVDMRLINQKTIFDCEPIADQEEIFANLAEDRYFTKIDLSKGYWQIPMAKDSKKYTAFVTPDGLYSFNMMPFGLVNAPATFSRIMRLLLQGVSKVSNYIDDILIHTQTWEEHMEKLKEVFHRLRNAQLTARPSKCFIGYEEIEFLGHVVGNGYVQPKRDKVESIQNAKRPVTKKQLRSFLGLIGFYRKYIPNFAAVASPLTDKTKKGLPNKIEWGESQEKAFQTLKGKLMQSPILHLPVLRKQFILRTDASDTGVGAVLMQEFEGEKFPIAFASKKLSECQKAYSVMERECLAVIWAVKKFEPYLYGREFILETDHQPLSCIQKSVVANGRIMRWALALQPYRYRIMAIKGADNVGADYMSRCIAAG